MKVVVSQSMYFPWVGLLEQVRLADTFVHYDDVQFTRGFYNRVQIKTPNGTPWLTVPTRDRHRGQLIDEVRIDDREDWRAAHRATLRAAYRQAPHLDEMLGIVDRVFSQSADTLGHVGRASIIELSRYFGLDSGTRFCDSRDLGIGGSSSQRLHDICVALGGSAYVTGHGAANYLDHHLFEQSDIEVRYMDYQRAPYPQLHGAFTPYVTALDLVANLGREGLSFIRSGSVSWKEFTHEPD
ncbi:WbqC family protein [Arenibacterium halophilum]|uniref:WbqC family protein n=1 Tax=Arenibacterium halophilum TaxID=2583821 RepID=A0ABY2XB00_9RHOB|nr:WbqC family protein [Arenibacterium halophilum]TMV13506.1 WbqC family protein [Arenibacterium halophilum]